MASLLIRDTNGAVRHTIDAVEGRPKMPWSQVFYDLADGSDKRIRELDFSRSVNEQVDLRGLCFETSILDFENMERSTFVDCAFKDTGFKQSNFHHLADRTDRKDRSMGTIFRRCRFENCTFVECDFVMSKFYDCRFVNCRLRRVDLRNAWWFDRHKYNPPSWEEIPELDDLFGRSTLENCKFGHPINNLTNLPVQMMIPRSFSSVWSHMSGVQRKMTKLGYLMREEKDTVFESAL